MQNELVVGDRAVGVCVVGDPGGATRVPCRAMAGPQPAEAVSHGFSVRPADAGDIALFAERLRDVDLREIAATSLAAPEAAIARCLAASDRTWVGLLDGEPMFISGISRANFMSARRAPWLLGTPLIDTHPRPFLRYTRAAMPGLLAAYPWMENHIDARSTRTIAWLRWLGFVIHDAKPYGALGRPFHRFSIGAPTNDPIHAPPTGDVPAEAVRDVPDGKQ